MFAPARRRNRCIHKIALAEIISKTGASWGIAGESRERPFRGAAERGRRGGIGKDFLKHGAGGYDAALAAKLRRHDARSGGGLRVAGA